MVDLKDRKKLSEFERYSENPSSGRHKIQDLIIGAGRWDVDIVVKEDDVVVDESEGVKWRISVYDKKNFVKLFPEAQADLVKLSSSGISVLTYVFVNLKKEQEQIVINHELFGEWYKTIEGCSDANVKMICYRGIIDLLRHEFLYLKTGEGSFFVNINKFFNGDRTKVEWVDDIKKKIKNKEHVLKSAVKYIPDYKPEKK
jgi:hypothetical protein